MYICMSVTLFGPRGSLRYGQAANVKAARLCLESSKVDLDRRLSVRGGGQSLTSLKVDLDRGLSACIIHVVLDGA